MYNNAFYNSEWEYESPEADGPEAHNMVCTYNGHHLRIRGQRYNKFYYSLEFNGETVLDVDDNEYHYQAEEEACGFLLALAVYEDLKLNK